jgi:hypothetical protein
MKHLGFILALLLLANAGKAAAIQGSGSKKRNRPQQPQVNIEDIIRAEEDPDFLQYVKERKTQEKEERAAALACERERRAQEVAYKKAQHQFLIKNYERAIRKAAKPRKPFVDEPIVWRKQQEKFHREYLAEHSKLMKKLYSERVARVQKALSIQRMPASAN